MCQTKEFEDLYFTDRKGRWTFIVGTTVVMATNISAVIMMYAGAHLLYPYAWKIMGTGLFYLHLILISFKNLIPVSLGQYCTVRLHHIFIISFKINNIYHHFLCRWRDAESWSVQTVGVLPTSSYRISSHWAK